MFSKNASIFPPTHFYWVHKKVKIYTTHVKKMFLPEFDSFNHINISLVRVTEEEGRGINPGPLRGFLV